MLLKLGCIERIATDWTSPVGLVKKDGGKDLRMCIDYRKLNKVMIAE